MTEMKLIKTFDRIDALVDAGRWSFRQPKKQRGVGGLTKTHWDYLLDEMVLHLTLFMDVHSPLRRNGCVSTSARNGNGRWLSLTTSLTLF